MSQQPSAKEKAKQTDANLKADIKRSENRMRLVLTTGFIVIYGVFLVSVVGFWFYDLIHPIEGRVQNIKDMIVTIYGLIATPFGLIVGFYFGTEQKNK
jgi:hypothetical protein